MNAREIIETWRECAHLSQSQIDRLTGAGVSVDALACDPGDYGFALASDRVAFGGAQFAFERHIRQPGEGVSAFIVPARDEFGEIVDLVAWRGEQLATWCGRVGTLGLQNIYAPRLECEGLPVAQSGIDWLRGDRRAVLIVNHDRARCELAHAGPFLAASIAHGCGLRDTLTHSPRILVPQIEKVAA
jgi:hypothetical protein